MESRPNMYDIYLHVKKMNLKSPDVFLTLVLREFKVINLGRFFMCLFYITCFLWHYPSHSVSILKAVRNVFYFKMKNFLNRWKESWLTYSPYADKMRTQIHSDIDHN